MKTSDYLGIGILGIVAYGIYKFQNAFSKPEVYSNNDNSSNDKQKEPETKLPTPQEVRIKIISDTGRAREIGKSIDPKKYFSVKSTEESPILVDPFIKSKALDPNRYAVSGIGGNIDTFAQQSLTNEKFIERQGLFLGGIESIKAGNIKPIQTSKSIQTNKKELTSQSVSIPITTLSNSKNIISSKSTPAVKTSNWIKQVGQGGIRKALR